MVGYPQRANQSFAPAGFTGESAGGGQSEDTSDNNRFSEANVQELDSTIEQLMQDENLPGVVVGVWVPGEGEYVVAKGEANLETGREREVNDPFRIASISKTFTATAILQLVDEGRLSTSDTLSKWYPDFPNADEITVDDLLRMRSGIADAWDLEFVEQYYDDPVKSLSPEDMIERAASKADQFEPPDQETKHTNVNYTLLAEIVERVSGNGFATQLEQGIFEPLGMERAPSTRPTASCPATCTVMGGIRRARSSKTRRYSTPLRQRGQES